VIVRGETNVRGSVVVGLDGSAADPPVLAAAFELARGTNASVHAIHAWDAPEPRLASAQWKPSGSRLEHEARTVLERALAPFESAFPAVPVERRLVSRSPTAALVAASEHAQIVVVGSHGTGALHGLLAGSVCHGVIYHAQCPVQVVPVADEVVHAPAPARPMIRLPAGTA
jgi:nucleotide-binding universal stress UspA family protein